jgi:hypothetical protein
MGDVPIRKPTEEEAEKIETFTREIIGGDPRAAIRRIVLYVLVFVLIVSPLPALAVAPLALLAMTDQLR